MWAGNIHTYIYSWKLCNLSVSDFQMKQIETRSSKSEIPGQIFQWEITMAKRERESDFFLWKIWQHTIFRHWCHNLWHFIWIWVWRQNLCHCFHSKADENKTGPKELISSPNDLESINLIVFESKHGRMIDIIHFIAALIWMHRRNSKEFRLKISVKRNKLQIKL